MNISAKGLEEDKNHFGVFLRFLLQRSENVFINRDYDNFLSTDVRQRKVSSFRGGLVSGGFRFQVSGKRSFFLTAPKSEVLSVLDFRLHSG